MDGTKTNSTEIDLTYFDDQLLSYYITTDRDGMAERAKERWYQRWHLAYPYRKRAVGIGGCWWHDHGKGEHAHIWIGLGRRYISVTFERRRHNNHWKDWEALLDERMGK